MIKSGTDSNDILHPDDPDTNDGLFGLAGDDRIYGDGGIDDLFGGDGNDSLYAGGSGTRLNGDEGNDSLFAGADAEALDGGTGADRLYAGAGADGLSGGAGDDFLDAGAGSDAANGDSGLDTIFGLTGADTLDGGSGSDLLYGGNDADRLNGGAGNDVIYGYGMIDSRTSARPHPTEVTSESSWSLLTYAIDIWSDPLQGGPGNDAIFGSFGDDMVIYSHASGAVQVDLLSGVVTGADGNDQLDGINGVTGSGFDDLLSGDNNTGSHANTLYGLAGADTINGRSGIDLVFGGAGADRLFGGGEADTISGDSGNDLSTGGGSSDVFLFQGTFGADRITDFQATGPDHDILQISNAAITDFASLLSHATQRAGFTLIDAGIAGTIRLDGVLRADLVSEDFLFS